MSLKIKICGITNLDDALAAVEAGADALGFMFFERSLRHLSDAKAAAIIRALPARVMKVGVFVNAPAERIRLAAADCGLTHLQLHGEETPEFCGQFAWPVIKAFRIKDAASLELLCAHATDAWLLDAYVPGQHGGTGARFNWSLAVEAKKRGRPIYLAGGLTPDNVEAAVAEVHPAGVDVSSGVEQSPGVKDMVKMRAFIAAARRGDITPIH